MIEQLSQLVKQFGGDAVVNNSAIPNELNDGVMQEASSSILSGLQNLVSQGGVEQLVGLLKGSNAASADNPVVQQITQQFSGSLGEKFGIDSGTASNVASGLIPSVLGSLVGKAKDPNDSSLGLTDLLGQISGGQGDQLIGAIQKYGAQFGLDQNADGSVDLGDVSGLMKNGGISGLLGKLFS